MRNLLHLSMKIHIILTITVFVRFDGTFYCPSVKIRGTRREPIPVLKSIDILIRFKFQLDKLSRGSLFVAMWVITFRDNMWRVARRTDSRKFVIMGQPREMYERNPSITLNMKGKGGQFWKWLTVQTIRRRIVCQGSMLAGWWQRRSRSDSKNFRNRLNKFSHTAQYGLYITSGWD